MSVTTYTSYAEVRAILGVSTDELEDSTIALPIYDSYLQGELDDIGSTLQTDFTTVAAIAVGTRTTAQKKFYQATTLFSAYAVAKQLTTALPMFGPKDISDGKATIGRFSDSPYKPVITAIQKEYDRLKARLESAFAGLVSSTVTVTPRSYMSAVSPSVDPVTGA